MSGSQTAVSRKTWGFIAAGVVIALALAFFVSPYASSKPDGLNKVAADKGLDAGAKASATKDSPLAGYDVKGDNSKLSKGVAGVIGVAVVFGLVMGLFGLVRLRSRNAPPTDELAGVTGSPGP